MNTNKPFLEIRSFAYRFNPMQDYFTASFNYVFSDIMGFQV